MSVDLTIQVPDELARELERVRDRLPEVLERGLREIQAENNPGVDEAAIMAILASQPTPEQVLAIRPSAEMQSRVSGLIGRSKDGELARSEEAELERFLVVEHLVRLAKGRALELLARGE